MIYQTDNRGPSLKEFTTIKPKTPKGFHISNIFENDRDLIIEYIMDADSKKVIIFSQDYIGDNAQSMHIDAENDEEWYESIEGIRVFCSRKDDVLELFWVTENQSFDICANVDFTILRMLAEEVCERLIY